MKYSSEKPVEFLVILDTLFVLFLTISGMSSGILSTLFYILGFIVPVFIGFRSTRETNNDKDFLSVKNARASLPFIAPTIGIVMIVSFLTSLIISLVAGKSNAADIGDNLLLAIITHALLTSVLEEALFRFIPLRMLRGKSWLVAIVYSALFFSLIHHSFFSMPYAFLAGAIFMLVDLICDSVWPSVIIHFLNNAFSVMFIFYSDLSYVRWIVIVLVAIFSIISILYIVKNIGKYEKIKEKITRLGDLEAPPKEVLILVIPMLILAVMELV